MAELHRVTHQRVGARLLPDSGARYGLSVGFVMFLFIEVTPRPWGAVTFWSLLATQGAIGTVIVWRRLRLRYFTAGGLSVTLASLAMVWYSWRGPTLATIAEAEPPAPTLAVWIALLLGPIVIGVEALVNSDGWQAWKRRMDEQPSIPEMLTFRRTFPTCVTVTPRECQKVTSGPSGMFPVRKERPPASGSRLQ